MVTQGLWQRDPVLMQLPHFTRELAASCAEKGGCCCWGLLQEERACFKGSGGILHSCPCDVT